MENVNIGAVPLIVVIVYGLLSVYKSVFKDNEKLVKIIPLIATIVGAGLGVAAFYLVPEIIPVDNALRALLLGGCSGLAATGTHQALKVFFNNNEEGIVIDDNPDDNDNDSTKDK